MGRKYPDISQSYPQQHLPEVQNMIKDALETPQLDHHRVNKEDPPHTISIITLHMDNSGAKVELKLLLLKRKFIS